MSGDTSAVSQSLIISNHRTRLDWMYLWCYCLRVGCLNDLRIMLKGDLKKLPAVGWGMQTFLFSFLDRDWRKDELYLANLLGYIRQLKLPSSLLMFPEGTDLSENRLSISHQFAEKMGLARYDYVLHPRVKGFHSCVQEMNVENVVDITIGYVDFVKGERPNEGSLLAARYPKEVHVFVTKFSRKDISAGEEGSEKWLKARFAEKEERLKKFYNDNQTFEVETSQESQQPLVLAWGFPAVLAFGGLIVLSVWLLFSTWWFRGFFITSILFWIIVTKQGGLDNLEVQHCYKGKK